MSVAGSSSARPQQGASRCDTFVLSYRTHHVRLQSYDVVRMTIYLSSLPSLRTICESSMRDSRSVWRAYGSTEVD
eukprot:3607888-Amphidinium_carterae.1